MGSAAVTSERGQHPVSGLGAGDTAQERRGLGWAGSEFSRALGLFPPHPHPRRHPHGRVPGGVTCRRPPGGQPLTRRPPLPEPAGSLLPGGELMGGWAQHPPAPSAGPTAGVRWRRETTAPPPGSPLGPLTLQAPGGARLPPAAAWPAPRGSGSRLPVASPNTLSGSHHLLQAAEETPSHSDPPGV